LEDEEPMEEELEEDLGDGIDVEAESGVGKAQLKVII
jgi:hypothetical protein